MDLLIVGTLAGLDGCGQVFDHLRGHGICGICEGRVGVLLCGVELLPNVLRDSVHINSLVAQQCNDVLEEKCLGR